MSTRDDIIEALQNNNIEIAHRGKWTDELESYQYRRYVLTWKGQDYIYEETRTINVDDGRVIFNEPIIFKAKRDIVPMIVWEKGPIVD